jgi:hypothetical protein
MTGGTLPSDVTMMGNATTTTTQTTQPSPLTLTGLPNTGTAAITFMATMTGQGESIQTTTAGTVSEIRDISSGVPSLIETGVDGVAQPVTTQSALSPHPAWFYPAMLLNTGLSSSNFASSYVGSEIWNGASVQHIAIWLLPAPSSSSGQPVVKHDVYLDASSMLPVGLTFATHPYDPANPNRPLVPYRGNSVDCVQQVTFSDYRQVEGRSVAFHIHSVLQTGLLNIVTDIQISSVTFNSGVVIPALSITSSR